MGIVLLGCLERDGAPYFMIVLAWTALVNGPSGGNCIFSLGVSFTFGVDTFNDVRDEDIYR